MEFELSRKIAVAAVVAVALSAGLALTLALLGGSSEERAVVGRVEELRDLWEQGELLRANEQAEALQQDYGARMEGWLWGARIASARWEQADSAELFIQAYGRDVANFPDLPQLVSVLMVVNYDEEELRGLLAEHARLRPDDPQLPVAHLLLEAHLLHVKRRQADREQVEQRLTALLDDFDEKECGSACHCYYVSEAFMVLGRWEEAMQAMRRGVTMDDVRWSRLTMLMTRSFVQLHRGEVEAARVGLERYLQLYADWPGYHYAMLMPMPEFLQLTWRVRFGQDLALPEGLLERRKAAVAQGVGAQYDAPLLAGALQGLLAALAEDDLPSTREQLSDLRTLLGRDVGCIAETKVIRPHIGSMLTVLDGDLQLEAGDAEAAQRSYRRALERFPDDRWLKNKLVAAQQEGEASGQP